MHGFPFPALLPSNSCSLKITISLPKPSKCKKIAQLGQKLMRHLHRQMTAIWLSEATVLAQFLHSITNSELNNPVQESSSHQQAAMLNPQCKKAHWSAIRVWTEYPLSQVTITSLGLNSFCLLQKSSFFHIFKRVNYHPIFCFSSWPQTICLLYWYKKLRISL